MASDPPPSGEVTDPTQLVVCRQVAEDLCFGYARSMIQGPQPEYAQATGIERVIVTCERFPPCTADRADAGGRITLLYTNRWAWTQDWFVGAGT